MSPILAMCALLGFVLSTAAQGAERVLIADFERDARGLVSRNGKIKVTRSTDAAVGRGAALVDWRDGEPGWSKGISVELPATEVRFQAARPRCGCSGRLR